MNMEETLDFFQSVSRLGSRPGLERVTQLLDLLGNPQNDLKYIHVAGTNGKGSVSAMIMSVLAQSGYTTGLYISPHLERYNERITVNGEEITHRELCEVAETAKNRAEQMTDKPTEFELITAMALLYFKQKQCDIVVLEAGLGGRLDATNAIPAPEVAVITNLGLEHTAVLGNTIQQIAAEKGGIIKPGCVAVSYDSAPEALEVLESICRELGVPLNCVDFRHLRPLSHSLEGQEFCWKEQIGLAVPLLGEHQLRNAAVALEALEALRVRGWNIGGDALRRGLQATRWPARLEVLAVEPVFLLDGGHNPQCVQALSKSIVQLLPGEKVTFLMGVLEDKDHQAMVSPVLSLAKRFVCVTPNSDRAMAGEMLAVMLRGYGAAASCCINIDEAIRFCLTFDDSPIVAFGSLYMAGDIRSSFGLVYRSWLNEKKLRRDALTGVLPERP